MIFSTNSTTGTITVSENSDPQYLKVERMVIDYRG